MYDFSRNCVRYVLVEPVGCFGRFGFVYVAVPRPLLIFVLGVRVAKVSM